MENNKLFMENNNNIDKVKLKQYKRILESVLDSVDKKPLEQSKFTLESIHDESNKELIIKPVVDFEIDKSIHEIHFREVTLKKIPPLSV